MTRIKSKYGKAKSSGIRMGRINVVLIGSHLTKEIPYCPNDLSNDRSLLQRKIGSLNEYVCPKCNFTFVLANEIPALPLLVDM